MIRIINTPDGKKHPIYDMDQAWQNLLDMADLDESKMTVAEQRNLKMAFMYGIADMFHVMTVGLTDIPDLESKTDFMLLIKSQISNWWEDAVKTPLSKKI